MLAVFLLCKKQGFHLPYNRCDTVFVGLLTKIVREFGIGPSVVDALAELPALQGLD